MGRDSNLHRRGAVYYSIITIPTDLQHLMDGKKQKWVSLKTKDYYEAKRNNAAVVDQWSKKFEEMRHHSDLTDEDIAVAVWDHYAAGLEAGDKERSGRPSQADIDVAFDAAMVEAQKTGATEKGPIAMMDAMADVEILANKAKWAARQRAARLKRLRLDLASGDTRFIEKNVDAFLSENGFQVAKDSPRYRDFCFKLMRADIEQLKRYAERDGGDYSGRPEDPIIVETAPPSGHDGNLIMQIFAKYERENPNSVRIDSMQQARRDVQHFADFLGSSATVSNIDKRQVRDWKELLADYPIRASETNIFKGLSLRQIIETNNALPHRKPAISRQTLRRYMGSVSGFCAWLERNDYLKINPVTGLIPAKAPASNKRSSFTDEAIADLFSSPLFTTCKSENWRDADKPGKVTVRNHRYWIPLVMAYSGARPGEIAQLHVKDVRQEHGIWIMHITEEGEGDKRTKTKGSMRVVPIHSRLVDLGFVRHCEAMKPKGCNQIFPELKIPKSGQIAAQFSREFNRYLTKIGLKDGRDIVLYSLRHTFVDKARRAGFLNEEIGTIVGHDKATMTGRYGMEQQGTLKRRAEIIESVAYHS